MTTHKLIRLTAAVLLAATVSSGTFATTAEWSPTVQAAAQNIKLNEKQAVAKFKQKYAKAKISEISLEKHQPKSLMPMIMKQPLSLIRSSAAKKLIN